MTKNHFDVAGYDEFKNRALNPALSYNERSGFSDEVRAGRSSIIFGDICSKLPALVVDGTKTLDIGPGCGELSQLIVSHTRQKSQHITLVDSREMLSHFDDGAGITKIEGPFPQCLKEIGDLKFDSILTYSVAQYVFKDSNLYGFVDAAASLLTESGSLLIGDIPNVSMRKRYLSSNAGRQNHERYYSGLPFPKLEHNAPEIGNIDDSVVVGLLLRLRAAGFQAFLVPQGKDLPMANRREDLLIRRPQ